MTDQWFRFVCEIFQIVPLDVRFQMRQIPAMHASYFWRNWAKNIIESLFKNYKRLFQCFETLI